MKNHDRCKLKDTQIDTHVIVSTTVHVYVWVYAWVYVWVYVWEYVWVYVWVYMYVRTFRVEDDCSDISWVNDKSSFKQSVSSTVRSWRIEWERRGVNRGGGEGEKSREGNEKCEE